MWNPVPGEYPVLEDGVLYTVTVDAFGDGSPATNCTQTYLGQFSDNIFGVILKAWMAGPNECRNNQGIIPLPGQPAQRLIDIQEA